MNEACRQVAADDRTLRTSTETKATVNVEPFDQGAKAAATRKGVSRLSFAPEAKVTPFGLLMLGGNEFLIWSVPESEAPFR